MRVVDGRDGSSVWTVFTVAGQVTCHAYTASDDVLHQAASHRQRQQSPYKLYISNLYRAAITDSIPE